jgi:hypothetical protein
MVATTPPEIADKHAWLVDDEKWMAARAKAWLPIEAWLRTNAYSGNELRQLHSYFVFGRMAANTKWRGRYLPSIPLFYRLWLHPDVSVDNWNTQSKFTTWEDYDASRDAFRHASSATPRAFGDEVERRLFEALLGGEPVRSFLHSDKYSYGIREWSTRSIAIFLPHADGALIGVNRVLASKTRVAIRPAVRLVMAQVLKHGLEVAWAEMFQKKERVAHLTNSLDLVASFSRKSPARAADRGARERIELARELAGLFDSGVGPARFQSLWRARRPSTKRVAATSPARSTKKPRPTSAKKKKAPAKRKAPKRKG